ncbi:hypothetical protein GGD55_002699 [Rhizobium giardinii]|uniref:Uncharacterized protein n=1 Tax=Rhizobium giardinii TaxID=56731 RepID=A0A7W8UDB5_9HYPH|nr:hypothetical protein [Rhizobium giardinii]
MRLKGDVSVQASAHGDNFPPESARTNRRNNGQAPSRRPIWTSRERKDEHGAGHATGGCGVLWNFEPIAHDTIREWIESPKRPVFKKARHCEHGSLSAAKSRRAWLSASLNECRRLGGSISGQSLVPGRGEAGCVIPIGRARAGDDRNLLRLAAARAALSAGMTATDAGASAIR